MMNFYYRLIKTFKCASMMIEKRGIMPGAIPRRSLAAYGFDAVSQQDCGPILKWAFIPGPAW